MPAASSTSAARPAMVHRTARSQRRLRLRGAGVLVGAGSGSSESMRSGFGIGQLQDTAQALGAAYGDGFSDKDASLNGASGRSDFRGFFRLLVWRWKP